MDKFIIEREIPEVGSLDRAQLRAAAAKSNEALAQLAPDVQWVESYVADDKTFCVYLAKDEAMIRATSAGSVTSPWSSAASPPDARTSAATSSAAPALLW